MVWSLKAKISVSQGFERAQTRSVLSCSLDTSSPLISSRRNPLVKRLRSLASRAAREAEGLLLLEGTHLLQEVLRWGSEPEEIIAPEVWLQRHPDLVARCPQACWRIVTDEVLRAAITTVTPDGVACLSPLDALPSVPSELDFVLVLDRIQDPGNLGTLLRTALAADVNAVWLGGWCRSSGDESVAGLCRRPAATAASTLWPQRSVGHPLLQQELNQLGASGVQVVATLVPDPPQADPPLPYWDLDWTLPTALVLGTEGAGRIRICGCCTLAVAPHSSRVESLNVASAAVPLLLERRRATMTPHRSSSGEHASRLRRHRHWCRLPARRCQTCRRARPEDGDR